MADQSVEINVTTLNKAGMRAAVLDVLVKGNPLHVMPMLVPMFDTWERNGIDVLVKKCYFKEVVQLTFDLDYGSLSAVVQMVAALGGLKPA